MEKKYFSIVHAINNVRNHNTNLEDYENKVIADNKRTLNITENADIIMSNNELYFKRAFNDGTTMSGGSQLIQPDYLPQEFVPFDRPQLTIDKVGGYSIPSNGQPISFTQCVSGATAAMYSVNGELSGGDMDFVLKQMTPHKCGCYIPIPYDLLLEGRPDIDSLVQADIVNALYQKRDEEIWTGDGTGNNITGIQSLTGINILTGASLSAGDAWGAMLSGVGAIRKANIFNENISYVMNTDTYITLKKTMKDDKNAYGGWVIEDDRIGNYPVYVNNAVSANTVLVGVGSDIAVTDFRGLGMIIDPYTYSTKQSLRVTAWISFDMVLRREKAWTKIVLDA